MNMLNFNDIFLNSAKLIQGIGTVLEFDKSRLFDDGNTCMLLEFKMGTLISCLEAWLCCNSEEQFW